MRRVVERWGRVGRGLVPVALCLGASAQFTRTEAPPARLVAGLVGGDGRLTFTVLFLGLLALLVGGQALLLRLLRRRRPADPS